MKKLLVPFDFSGASFNAAGHALQIAQQTKAHITFLCSNILPSLQDDVPGPAENGLPGIDQPILMWKMLKSMLDALCINEKQSHINYLFNESLEGDSLETVLQKNTYDLVITGIEGTTEKTPFPWDKRMAQRMLDINAPFMVIPVKAPFQLVGIITLVTDFLNIKAKNALSLLFDLVEAFKTHFHIVYVGHQNLKANCFRQAVKQLGLVSRLDALRHTYHFAHPDDEKKELEEMVNRSSTNILVLFKQRQATLSELEVIQNLILHSQVPLLLLPINEEAAHQAGKSTLTLERAAFANSF